MKKFFTNETMESEVELGERVVSGLNTVLHCHHYNSRLQKTLESSELIQGRDIIRKAAARTFEKQVRHSLHKFKAKDTNDKLLIASELYSYLGFGILNFEQVFENKITSSCSHFVEGWKSGYKQENRKVCTFVEGFLEGALFAVEGKHYKVRESACMNEGSECCIFELQPDEPSDLFAFDYIRNSIAPKNKGDLQAVKESTISTTVDLYAIQKAVIEMPLFGNNYGIIPAFNVYLAHMPRDFYNLVCLEYMDQMRAIGMAEIAHDFLEEDAETCSLNTFAGIMQSEEWAALIEPMIKRTEDNLYALIAVSNALGWGITHIASHVPYESLELRTANGYESIGTLEIKGPGEGTDCPMLSGVAAGLMSLVYGNGDFNCRKGAYKTAETLCISKEDPFCAFTTQIASVKQVKKGA